MFSKCTKTISLITAAFVATSLLASCASEETPEPEPSIPESSIEESVTETTEATTKATTETTDTTVYIYNGYYYLENDQVIDGKTGLESMSLSDAKKQGYADGSKQTDDERYEYDYNLAYYMVEQGYSDEEIVAEIKDYGYSNETTASFLVGYVRQDYEDGIRTYPEPKDPIVVSFETEPSESSSSSGSSSSESSSGSGSSSSDGSSSSGGNSGSSGSDTTPTTTQPAATDPAPVETTSAPAATEPPATEPPATDPPPTEAYILYYEVHGSAFYNDSGEKITGLTFQGSSAEDAVNQYYNYCDNNNLSAGSYTCYSVWSDGKVKSA